MRRQQDIRLPDGHVRDPWRAAIAGFGLATVMIFGACGSDGNRSITVAQGASTAVMGDATGGEAAAGEAAAGASQSGAAPTAAPSSEVVASAAAEQPPTPRATPAANASTAPQLASIHGVVTRGGKPAPGARLTLAAGDGSERIVTADGDGAYRFTAVPAGRYELMAYGESGPTCDAAGCISASWAERVDVTVAAGETVRVDVDGD